MSLRLTFDITLRSDYHVDAGHGLGFGVDAALQRDADGVPVLRGSGIVGLLRGGLEWLTKLPPLGGYKQDLSDQLFGTPKRAKRWHFTSARPVGLEQPLRKGAWHPGQDGAQQVTRVRVDPRTRRAKPRRLFSQETGDASLEFRFTATCPFADDAALDEAALLVAAARYVRQLGGSRRRGLGECVIHLMDIDGVPESFDSTEAGFLQRFRDVWLEGTPHLLGDENETAPEYPATLPIPAYAGTGVRVRFIVRLDEPLVIAERAAAGNQFDTRHTIPGSVVRGALAGLAARRNDLEDPQTYGEFVALFLRGGITFPNLYPAYHHENNLYPTAPAPLGLLTCEVAPFGQKSEGHGVWALGSPEARERKCRVCGGRLKPVEGFVVLRQKGPYTVAPDEKVELHIRIDPKSNRVSHGDLYGYTALNAGQYFVGELVCADEAAWSRLQALTGLKEKEFFILRLGKARRRGYGRVKVRMERCDDEPLTWLQVPLKARVHNLDQPVTLTLLTDTLIVDRWGRQATGFDREWLEQALEPDGLQGETRKGDGFDPGWLERALELGPVQVEDASTRTKKVDGFNSQIGLPRWRDQVLLAGSTARLILTNPPSDWAARMARLESEGIGLRRNEGFGRIAFNHPAYEGCQNVMGSAIRLAREMRLGRPVNKRRQFIQRWEARLEQDSDFARCRDQRFASVARTLHTHADDSPQDLLDRLDKFGEPDTTLIDTIDEYGCRSKDNFFKKEGQDGGKEGMEVIKRALNSLIQEDKALWPLGIQILAKRVAAAVESEDKEGRK
jgi:CRISPR-associated protein Csx10